MGEVHTLTSNYIHDAVQSRIKKYRTRDPFTIAQESGITLIQDPTLDVMKGIYTIIRRNRFIIINSNLSECMKKIVCAHELGHDALHQDFARKRALQEFMHYDMKSKPEYEANMYAAELLFGDDEIMELVREGRDMQQIAGILRTDINLIALKAENMNHRGYNLNFGIESRSNFLRS